MYFKKFFITFFIVALLQIQISLCTFDPIDKIEYNKILVTEAKNVASPDGPTNAFVAFPDNKFGVVYVNNSDNKLYAGFQKHGAFVTTPVLINVSGTPQGAKGCNIDDNYMFVSVYVNDGNWKTYGVTLQVSDGTIIGSILNFTTKNSFTYTRYGGCTAYDTKKVAISYCAQGGGSDDWDSCYATYDIDTDTFSGNIAKFSHKFVNAYRPNFQGNTDIALNPNPDPSLEDRLLYTWSGQGIEEPIDKNLGAIYFQRMKIDGTNILQEEYVLGTGGLSANDTAPKLVPLSVGGFGASWYTKDSPNECFYTRWDWDLTQRCRIMFSEDCFRPDFTEKEGVVYMTMRGVNDNKLYVYEINASDCSKIRDITTVIEFEDDGTTAVETQESLINVSQDSVTKIIGILTLVKSTTPYQVRYYEYIIEQLQNCDQNQCSGCHEDITASGVENCKMCAGATLEQRHVRTRDDGSCLCDDGFFDDQPNLDCSPCADKCATCVNVLDFCVECKYAHRDPPDCPCKFDYYEDQGICEKCNPKCVTCISMDICSGDACADPTQKMPFCQESPKKTYYATDNGITMVIKICDKQCNTCFGTSDNCLSCVPAGNRSIETSECLCEQGYYDKAGTLQKCEACSFRCVTCYEKADLCTGDLCYDPKMQMPYCTTEIGKSLTVVVDGVVVELTCNKNCETCETSPENCTMCKGSNRNDDPPACSCQTGYSDNDGLSENCLEITCPNYCEDCDLLTKECHTCQTGLVLDDLGQCVCAEGTTRFQEQCLPDCDEKSEYRNRESQACEKCLWYKEVCVDICPEGTEQSGSNCEIASDVQSMMLIILSACVGLLLVILVCLINYKKTKQLGMEYYKKQPIQQSDQENQNNKLVESEVQDDLKLNDSGDNKSKISKTSTSKKPLQSLDKNDDVEIQSQQKQSGRTHENLSFNQQNNNFEIQSQIQNQEDLQEQQQQMSQRSQKEQTNQPQNNSNENVEIIDDEQDIPQDNEVQNIE